MILGVPSNPNRCIILLNYSKKLAAKSCDLRTKILQRAGGLSSRFVGTQPFQALFSQHKAQGI